MKKIKLILAFAMCAVLVNSCKEDDLELTNPGQLSPDTFFKTRTQVQSAVNAAYANLQTQGLYSRHMFFMMDNMSQENSGNSQLEADKRQYMDFSFDSSHGAIGLYWDACFRGINKANFVIGNEESITLAVNEADKSIFLGEAKFMRAYYYFLLVTRFGDVPLITVIPEGGEGFPKNPKADVYAQIISDLEAASAGLLSKGAMENGRATKEAAIAMLGKVYLFMGNKGAAMTEFNKLTGFSLEDNYFDNFTEEGEHGPESIFEVEYDDDLGTGSKWGSDGSGANEATFRGQEYGMLNWFNVYPSDDLLDEYEVGDSRLMDNFYVENSVIGGTGDTVKTGVAPDPVPAGEYYIANERRAGWKKYQNYYKDASEDQDSGINFKIIRYADILLMQAECVYESDPGAAMGFINQVRSRPSVMLPDVTGLTGAALFAAIVHERKVELAGEQIRFPDIVRWGNAATELAGSNFTAGKHEVFPIPDSEISSNENMSNEDQNSGY